MLNYAVYANLFSRGAKIMLNVLNYANYALCSDSAIMPKSNAGIIGLAQSGWPKSWAHVDHLVVAAPYSFWRHIHMKLYMNSP